MENSKKLSQGKLTEKDRWFFEQKADILAEQLIGKIICRKINERIIKIRITATEAYGPCDDSACYPVSTADGKPSQAAIILECGGVCYTRDISKKGAERGYDKFMVVSGETGAAENVLISEATSIDGFENYNGSSKVVAALEIDQTDNVYGISLFGNTIWIENDFMQQNILKKIRRLGKYQSNKILQKDKEKLWRFYIDTKINLCDTCTKRDDFPYCNDFPKGNDMIEHGDGVGDDNIYKCTQYKRVEDNK